MQVTPTKLSKFTLSPKILNANQMLTSYLPHITVVQYTFTHKQYTERHKTNNI